jgi:hypothetical protein
LIPPAEKASRASNATNGRAQRTILSLMDGRLT